MDPGIFFVAIKKEEKEKKKKTDIPSFPMAPPEVWGPPVWTLFHVLAERIYEDAYPSLYRELFAKIIRICRYLPCPDCSDHATTFLSRVIQSNLRCKEDFRRLLFMFHNMVNYRKRKRPFAYPDVSPKYASLRVIPVVNNFIAVYHTKGNMKLLAESFQRQLIVREFKEWFIRNVHGFIRPNPPPPNPPIAPTSHEEEKVQMVEEEEVERIQLHISSIE